MLQRASIAVCSVGRSTAHLCRTPWNCWREPPSGRSPKEKWQITKIPRGISSPESLLVNRGEFTLISPVGLVKPFLMLMRGKVWRPFLARKGERCMKDTVHAAVHRSVHLFGEGKFYGALRLRFTRPLILDKGKTPEWAGATPLRCHGNRGGRSSPHECSEARRGAKGDRDAASHPEELRASREVRILRSGNL